MGKISESRSELLRPDFANANALLTSGLTSMQASLNPLKTAIETNLDNRTIQAKGQLANFIQQNMPTDYSSNPEAARSFQEAMNSTYNNSNSFANGVTAADLNTMITGRESSNLSMQKEQAANTEINLKNVSTADTYQLNQIKTAVMNAGGKPNDVVRIAAENGLVVDVRGNLIADDTATALNNNSHNSPLFDVQKTLTGANIAASTLNSGAQNFENNQGVLNADTQNTLNRVFQEGANGGKPQALTGNTVSNPISASSSYQPTISAASTKYNVPDKLISAMISAESSGNNSAVSSKGARGLMQLIPSTAAMLQKKYKLSNTTSPENNIKAGTAYIAELQKKYGSTSLALMAYNWGPGNVDKWIKKGSKTSAIPTETKNYLSRIAANMKGGQSGTGVTTYQGNVNKTNKNIVYANQGAKRNQPLNTNLTNVMSSVLKPLGVTMKVHSGGQSETSRGKEGGPRHNHGAAADADFYINNGKTKLSFKNKEHRAILSQIIEESAAQGVQGIGGGEGYMPDGRLHVGYGSSATWGGNKGKGSAPQWIRDAHAKGVARGGGRNTSTSGYAVGGGDGGVDLSEALSKLSINGLDNSNISDTIKASLGLSNNYLSNTNKLMGMVQTNDRESMGLGAIGTRSMLPQNGGGNTKEILGVLNNDSEASLGLLETARTNARKDTQNALTGLASNNTALSLADAAYQRAAAASAGGDSLPFDALFDTTEEANAARKMMNKQGITSEVFGNLDGNSQKAVINEVIQYQQNKGKGAIATNQATTAYVAGLVSTPKQASKVFNKDAVKALEQDSLTQFLKWKDEETNGDRFWKSFTTINKADERGKAMKSVHKQMGEVALDMYNNSPEYQGKFKARDLVNVTRQAKKLYDNEMRRRGEPESKDLYGYSDKIINPGLYEIVLKTAFKQGFLVANQNITKHTKGKYVPEPILKNVITNGLVGMIGSKVE